MANSTAERSRTVCQSCELPYYAARSACPYCTTAGASGPETPEDSAGSGQGDVRAESPPGLLARLKNAIGR